MRPGDIYIQTRKEQLLIYILTADEGASNSGVISKKIVFDIVGDRLRHNAYDSTNHKFINYKDEHLFKSRRTKLSDLGENHKYADTIAKALLMS